MPIYDCSPKGSSTEVTGVTSFNNRTGAVMPQAGDYDASDVGAVDISTTVNGKQLNQNITLSAEDVNADPEGSAQGVQTNLTNHINDKNNPHEVSAEQVGALTEQQADDKYLSLNGGTMEGNIDMQGCKIQMVAPGTDGGDAVNFAQLAQKQNLITGAASTVTSSNLNANRVVISNNIGKIDDSNVTSTELNYLTGSTENIEQRFDNIESFNFSGSPILEIVATSSSETYEEYCAKVDAALSAMPNNTIKAVRAYPPAMYGQVATTISILYRGANLDYCGLFNIGSCDNLCNGWRMIKLRWPSSGSDSIWMPFEWVNPPLIAGIEYRTVERYQGKPVYAKLVDLGAMPNNSEKLVEYAGGDATTRTIEAHGVMSGGFVIPGCTGSSGYPIQVMDIITNNTQVGVITHTDRSAHTAQIVVKYWRTSD